VTREELVEELLDLLSRPGPPRVVATEVPPNTFDLDWDALRLMVRIKMFKEGINVRALANMIELADTALARFLHKPGKYLEPRSVIRLMAWLGYTDFEPFLKET
jgi:hypothetical protein